MRTTILITEQQKRVLIIESLNDELNDKLKKNTNLISRIRKFSSEEFSNNLGFLITWGAGIGGFMGPVNDFLSGQYDGLSEHETYLILLGVIGTIFMNGKDFTKDVISKINDEGLINVFKTTLSKAKDLKKTFISFLKSLDINANSMVTMLSYAFMIPVLGPIIKFIQEGNITYDDLKLFVSSLGMSKFTTISGKTISEFLKKLINKLS
jgi:hypothetical protein